MFKNILIVAITIVVANSGGCSTTPTTTPTPVTVKSFLQELALANPQLQEQAGDQMVPDWRAQQVLPYPHGWATEGEAGLERWEDYLERFKRKYPD